MTTITVRKRFVTHSLLVLFAGLSAVCGTAGWTGSQIAPNDPQSISAVESRRRLGAHQSDIDERLKLMNSRYFYGPAASTLKQALQQNGVKQSLPSSENWGNNGVWLVWEQALPFYRHHSQALTETLNSLPAEGNVSTADQNYFDEGMRGWKSHEQQLEKYMEELVAIYVKEGVNLDKQFAVQEKFSQLRADAASRNDSKLIDRLKGEEAEALKPLKLEAQQLFDSRTGLRKTIEEHAKKRFFDAIKFRGSGSNMQPTRTRPPEEKRTPEPLVLIGRELGAAKSEKP